MEYCKTITLRDGRQCLLRNGTAQDAQASLDVFVRTHEQTDELLSYPDEITFTAREQADYLQKKTDSRGEIEILAIVDGTVAGLGGIECVGTQYKLRHRAEFGVSIDRSYWRLGIGRALTEACIECAKRAGYAQLELEVGADNEAALALYRSAGFTECGRNPRGFRSRLRGWQELVRMRLELDSSGILPEQTE